MLPPNIPTGIEIEGDYVVIMHEEGSEFTALFRPSWHEEINWKYLRIFATGHCIFWCFGALLWALSTVGSLTGQVGKLLGLIAFLIWIGSLVGLFPLISTARGIGGKRSLSTQTWIVVGIFLLSSLLFLFLLVLIDLGTVLI